MLFIVIAVIDQGFKHLAIPINRNNRRS